MSDQDFFFDEEDQPADKASAAAAKPAAKPAKAAPVKSTAATPAKSVATPASGLELTWTVTALIGIVALLAGVIIGYVIPKNTSGGVATTTAGAGVTQQAPQLSPEQMQSGQLPAGHPDISGATGSNAPSSTAATTGK